MKGISFLVTAVLVFSGYTSAVMAASWNVVHPFGDKEEFVLDILEASLKASGEAYTLTYSEPSVTEPPPVDLLASRKKYTVAISESDYPKSNDVMKLGIPIFFGLSSYRVMVMRSSLADQINSITDSRALKNYVIGQTYTSVDSDVYEFNSYKVVQYDNASLYQALKLREIDIIPIPLTDFLGMEQLSYDAPEDLSFYLYSFFYSPKTVNFYVAKDNPGLLQAIDRGMLRLLRSGEMMSLFRSNFLKSPVIKSFCSPSASVIKLNPIVPSNRYHISSPEMFCNI